VLQSKLNLQKTPNDAVNQLSLFAELPLASEPEMAAKPGEARLFNEAKGDLARSLAAQGPDSAFIRPSADLEG